MAKITFLLVLMATLYCTPATAQYNVKLYDRLNRELDDARSDSLRINIMLALADYHVEQSYMTGFEKSIDTAYMYGKKCMDLSKAIKSEKFQADTYLLYSKALNYQSNYPESIKYAEKGITIFTKNGDERGLYRAKRALYLAYIYGKDHDIMFKQAKENLDLALKIGDNAIIGRAYEDQALVYKSFSYERKLAPELYLKAIAAYCKAGEQAIQTAYAGLSLLYAESDEYDKMVKATLKATGLVKKFNDRSYYASGIYKAAGFAYENIKSYPEAAYYYKLAYENSKRYIDIQETVGILANLLSIYNDSKLTKETDYYLHELEKLYDQGDDIQLKITAVGTILSRYIKCKNENKIDKFYKIQLSLMSQLPSLNDKSYGYSSLLEYAMYKKDYAYARKLIYKFKDAGNRTGTNQPRQQLYDYTLFKIDSAEGKYLSAIKHSQLVFTGRDSIFNAGRDKRILELQIAYNVAEKNKDNLLLKKEALLQQSKISQLSLIKNIVAGTSIFLAIIALLLFYGYRLKRKSNRQLQNQKAEIDTKNRSLQKLLGEKELLMKEIHHRVKNNLQIVMSLLNAQSHYLNDKAASVAIKNSQHRIQSMALIHKKLYQSDNLETIGMSIYIKELIEYLRKAFDTGQRIRFSTDIEAISLDAAQAVPLGLIINEAVTNAIKYAFPNRENGLILISFKNSETGTCVLLIEDDGVGVEEGFAINKTASLGMKLIQGLSGDLDASLIVSTANGLSIRIEFCPDNHICGLSDISDDKLTA